MSQKVRLPEINKKPGVYYTLTDDGVELPIIDVTHPSFAVVNPPDLPQRIDSAIENWKRHERIPKPLRVLFLWFFTRQLFLMKGIRKASGTFLGGMATYMMKLGPENLGAAYSRKFDKTIASDRLGAYLKDLELKNSIIAASSEGGLFDYSSTAEIIANLKVLHEMTPESVVLFGTLTPAEGKALGLVSETGKSSVVRRTIKEFSDLVERTSWIVKESYDQTMHYIVELRKR
jgi:hypothetical protein